MNAVEIEVDVPAVMRDGTVLLADVYRPGGPGSWPVLVQRTPYGRSSFQNYSILAPLEAAARGYIVVHQDTRGTGGSAGEWRPFAFEREDGFDTVEWAARLRGADGRVGMIGASYTGSTQWNAALTHPPALRSIAPLVTWSEPFDGLLFRGGAMELGLNTVWALGQALGQVPRLAVPEEERAALAARLAAAVDHVVDGAFRELPSGAQPTVVATGLPDLGVARALADPASTDDMRIAGRWDEITTPSLVVAGWYDLFLQGALDNHAAMQARGVPTHLVVGPWNHYSLYGIDGGQTGEVNFGSAALAPPAHGSLGGLQLDWHDHWLRDAPETDLHRPGVELFVMGRDAWRSEPAWPLERAVETPLFLHGDGAAGFTAPGEGAGSSAFVADPLDPVPTRGGAMLMTSDFPPGPADQRRIEARADVLTFTTEPLEADLGVIGRVRAVLVADSDAPSADWVVRLCDVHEDGTSINVVDGIARTGQGDPGRSGDDSGGGGEGEVAVDLWSTAMVFRAGHRLRVHVAGTSFPRWDRNPHTAEPAATSTDLRPALQRVHHDAARPSRLLLPVVSE